MWERARADRVGGGTQLWGIELSSPVGLAAGFDKDGEAVDGACAVSVVGSGCAR
jgi:dihydroorotate dehydrogenase